MQEYDLPWGLFEHLITLCDQHRYAEVRPAVSGIAPTDLSEVIELCPEAYQTRIFRLLPKSAAAEVFLELTAEVQARIVDCFTDGELSAMLEELHADDTAHMLEEMPANVAARILRHAKEEDREKINQLLGYPRASAGAIMTTAYVRLSAEMSVEEALSALRVAAIDSEAVYTSYVTDGERHLVATVSARELLAAEGQTPICSLMERHFVFAHTDDERETVARKLEKYGLFALPIVDTEERLVGIVTAPDALDVLNEEAEADFAKMAAVTPDEVPYIRRGVFSIYKSRIPWLLLLMVSAVFSGAILSYFEAGLPAVFLLFVPMLMDTGGNAGSQSSVTLIRALSVERVRRADVGRILYKELSVGALAGLTLGAVAFLKVILIDRLLLSNPAVTLSVAVSVSITLALTALLAKCVGTLLPLGARALRLDPAVMASPLITTLVDILCLLLYYFIASFVVGL